MSKPEGCESEEGCQSEEESDTREVQEPAGIPSILQPAPRTRKTGMDGVRVPRKGARRIIIRAAKRLVQGIIIGYRNQGQDCCLCAEHAGTATIDW